jgi:hypothetical protein
LTDARISELDSLGFVWKATTPKEGLAGDELWKKGSQNISGLSASQEDPPNDIDQDAAPLNSRTISLPVDDVWKKRVEELIVGVVDEFEGEGTNRWSDLFPGLHLEGKKYLFRDWDSTSIYL